jgi:type IV secretory pathway TraG/TraD family ATPase VirD4
VAAGAKRFPEAREGQAKLERASSTTSRGLGARESTTRSEQQRDVASAQELQQLRRRRALVVHGRDLPMVVKGEPYYRRADLWPLLSA